MSTQSEQLKRIHGAVAAFNRRDAASVLRKLGAGFARNRGDGEPAVARDVCAAQLRGLLRAFPDASLSEVSCLALVPDAVLVEWVFEGTHLGDWRLPGSDTHIAATGRRVRVVGSDLVRFNQDAEPLLDEARIDTASLLPQLGANSAAAPEAIRLLAERYTAAWCSQNPPRVASFFSEQGSLTVNGSPAAVGRTAIAKTARAFMTAFPDLQVIMDDLLVQGDRAVYLWTLVGTNRGPGGNGKKVRSSGFEVWRIGADGLIAESRGHFDSGGYLRQIS